jgi:tetratricopeptide (TPR) repeat protein
MFKFYVNATLSSDFFNEEEQEKGEKYFQKAIEAYDRMVDKTVIDDYDYGMLYAEAGAYYYRDNQYEKALKVLYKGLELVPDHERLTARLKIVLDKKVMAYEEDDIEDKDDDVEYIQYFEAEDE